jgi:3-oxoacyl-[acyl-carrier protein] reductase
MRLKDNVAIVTGSGRGIGREIALAFAKEGAKVVVNSRSENAYNVRSEVLDMGAESIAIRADVSSRAQVENMAQETLARFGRIDILVNNAAIYTDISLSKMEEKDWDSVLDINLKGTFNCIKASLPAMVKQRYGKIINIVSVLGTILGGAKRTHYSASKAGVLGLTKAAAVELGPYGINVNAIAVGGVETPGMQTFQDQLEQSKAWFPLRRVGQPADIAGCAVFLASEEAGYITGQSLVADGGWSIV